MTIILTQKKLALYVAEAYVELHYHSMGHRTKNQKTNITIIN